MASDIRNQFNSLERALRKVRIQLIDDFEELRRGSPTVVVALMRQLLFTSSPVVTKLFQARQCSPTDSDRRMLNVMYDIFREDLRYIPQITVEQLLSKGFAGHKLMILTKVAEYVSTKDKKFRSPSTVNTVLVIPQEMTAITPQETSNQLIIRSSESHPEQIPKNRRQSTSPAPHLYMPTRPLDNSWRDGETGDEEDSMYNQLLQDQLLNDDVQERKRLDEELRRKMRRLQLMNQGTTCDDDGDSPNNSSPEKSSPPVILNSQWPMTDLTRQIASQTKEKKKKPIEHVVLNTKAQPPTQKQQQRAQQLAAARQVILDPNESIERLDYDSRFTMISYQDTPLSHSPFTHQTPSPYPSRHHQISSQPNLASHYTATHDGYRNLSTSHPPIDVQSYHQTYPLRGHPPSRGRQVSHHVGGNRGDDSDDSDETSLITPPIRAPNHFTLRTPQTPHDYEEHRLRLHEESVRQFIEQHAEKLLLKKLPSLLESGRLGSQLSQFVESAVVEHLNSNTPSMLKNINSKTTSSLNISDINSKEFEALVDARVEAQLTKRLEAALSAQEKKFEKIMEERLSAVVAKSEHTFNKLVEAIDGEFVALNKSISTLEAMIGKSKSNDSMTRTAPSPPASSVFF